MVIFIGAAVAYVTVRLLAPTLSDHQNNMLGGDHMGMGMGPGGQSGTAGSVQPGDHRGDRQHPRRPPEAARGPGKLQAGDTLVIYKPDRVARSMKELLVLLDDQLHARGVNLHLLTGVCAGIHRPDGAAIADKMLFMVAAMERDLIRERTLDGLRAAQAQGRRGGRPAAVNEDVLAVARARQSRGESVTAPTSHRVRSRWERQSPGTRTRESPWARPRTG